jgi:hypothetical protein
MLGALFAGYVVVVVLIAIVGDLSRAVRAKARNELLEQRAERSGVHER